MSLLELDRYYTPSVIARDVVGVAGVREVDRCLDSACGTGSLLEAAQAAFGDVQCIGMDLDRCALDRLRRRNPGWILSLADALAPASWRSAAAAQRSIGCDLALLNPPFSMGAKKGLVLSLSGFSARCSVAMAHVLNVLDRARPKVCCAIVPESFLFAELDAAARAHIAVRYDIQRMLELRSHTFKGARANAMVVRLTARTDASSQPAQLPTKGALVSSQLVRGGLPCCEAVTARNGIPYVHSTDLGALTSSSKSPRLRRVQRLARGVVSGHVILLPRVGVPSRAQTRAVHLGGDVQLSDCVLALCVNSRASALRWQGMFARRWAELLALYRGTGARYTTVARLENWLRRLERALPGPRARRVVQGRPHCGAT